MQERIRIGKELLEAKRIEEENERKRSGSASKFIVAHLVFCFECTQLQEKNASSCRLLALRKAEKEEEKSAREKIKQKLEEDKVPTFLNHFVLSFFYRACSYLTRESDHINGF